MLRYRGHSLSLLLVAAAVAALAPSRGAPGQLPGLGLEVAYLALEPRRPAPVYRLEEGLPAPFDPLTGEPLSLEEAAALEREYARGDAVTLRARVVNHDTEPSGPFAYTWRIDARRVETGTHPGLSPGLRAGSGSEPWAVAGQALAAAPLTEGSFVDLEYEWSFHPGRETVSLTILPEGAPAATFPAWERRERVDARRIAVLTRPAIYNQFAEEASTGGESFEWWVREQAAALSDYFARALPPVERGAVRVDEIRVLAADVPPGAADDLRAAAGWDVLLDVTQLPPTILGAPPPLVGEILRQLGLAPAGELPLPGERNRLLDPETGAPLRLGYPVPIPGAWQADDGPVLTEYAARALDRRLASRATLPGLHLLDLPRENLVRALDNEGRSIPGARLVFYQMEGGELFGEPVFAGQADRDGQFLLPDRPAPEFTLPGGYRLRPNPFGALELDGSNGLFLVEVSARGARDYAWLPLAEFNLAAWRGELRRATYDLPTRLPAEETIRPPAAVRAEPVAESQRGARITWEPAAEQRPHLFGYLIYRADPPDHRWRQIGVVTRRLTAYTDTAEPRPPAGAAVRYAVSSVTRLGRESALSPTVVLEFPGLAGGR